MHRGLQAALIHHVPFSALDRDLFMVGENGVSSASDVVSMRSFKFASKSVSYYIFTDDKYELF